MGDIGFELPRETPGETGIGIIGGAESGALPADPPPAEAKDRPRDPLLRLVVRRWRRLTAEQCLAIVEIATASRRPDPGLARRQ
jgi:hypothetical protein